MAKTHDVIVLGAGPAGLATALMLRKTTDLSVLVLDAGPPHRERFGESTAPEIILPLAKLGLLERFRNDRHVPSPGNVSIWAGERPGTHDALYSPMGPPWRLERARFDQMLEEEACAQGVELHWDTRYLKSECEEQGHRLWVRGAIVGEHCAPWVVDASGASARFARAQGAKRQEGDRLFALARYAYFEGPPPSWQTFLEATDNGWFYAARLPDQRIVQMFVGEAESVARMREDEHHGFAQALETTRLIGPKFAPLNLSAHRFHGTAIHSSQLDRVCGPGWLACGDAASSYDPIVARGLTKALEDAIAAAAHIKGTLSAEAYQRRCEARYQDYQTVRQNLYQQANRKNPFWRNRSILQLV